MMRTDKHFELLVSRDRLWRNAACFYKNCLHHQERLSYDLHIEFQGEEGIDAGALKCEFFECLMKEVNERLFEGEITRRLPKRDNGVERNHEIAGIIFGHSILQGGPAFPVLCPAVFDYLVYGDEFPSVEDIPKNAVTEGIIELIMEVSKCF